MSVSEKQEFLRENILEAGYKAETFINFLEAKREDGGNIEVWEMEELNQAVEEFKAQMNDGEEIKRRKTTKDEHLAVFGDHEDEKESQEKSKSMSSDSDNLENEYKTDIPAQDGNNKISNSSKSGSSMAENDPANDEDEEDEEEDIEEEQNNQRYYNKRECGKYQKTVLVDAQDTKVSVSNPENVKGKGLKSSYTVYTVKLSPFDWNVKRRYSDFEWLVKCLQKRFPANYVRIA